jgi:hypothetical protein
MEQKKQRRVTKMIYLAISLEDFHANQKLGTGETTTRIKIMDFHSRTRAEEYFRKNFPDYPCVIIPKRYFDMNILRSAK